jgi:hypothetical protein
MVADARGRFDAPFWAVVVVALLMIGWGSATFVAMSSADRMVEISQSGARLF